MIVLFTAWRRYPLVKRHLIEEALTGVLEASRALGGDQRLTVRHGDAAGGDTIARQWVERRQGRDPWVQQEPYPADWRGLGKRAGPIRNGAMVRLYPVANLCVAFPGPPGESPGTADCIAQANAAGIPPWIHPWDRPAPPLPNLGAILARRPAADL